MAPPVNASASTVNTGAAVWIRRARLLIAVAAVWVGLHYFVGHWLMPSGLNRPILLAAAPQPALAALGLALVVCAAAVVTPRISGTSRPEHGLLITCLALAAWLTTSGTMTDWLILATDGTGPPSGDPYWPLIIEYIFLAVLMPVAAALAALATPAADNPLTPGASFRRAFPWNAPARERRPGILALVVSTGVILLLMLVLTGSRTGQTMRGQVYFAVAVASLIAVFVATRVARVRSPIWFWPAPLLAGLIGAVVAAAGPDLLIPDAYNQLSSIPAWGPVRPLPLEMVSVGVAVTLWSLRAHVRTARRHAA
jgi:hypothetical protein